MTVLPVSKGSDWLRRAAENEVLRGILHQVAEEHPFPPPSWHGEVEVASARVRTAEHLTLLAQEAGKRAGKTFCPKCLHPHNNVLAMLTRGCGENGKCRGSGDFHADGVYCSVDRLFTHTCPIQPGYHSEGK